VGEFVRLYRPCKCLKNSHHSDYKNRLHSVPTVGDHIQYMYKFCNPNVSAAFPLPTPSFSIEYAWYNNNRIPYQIIPICTLDIRGSSTHWVYQKLIKSRAPALRAYNGLDTFGH
jgi:hypothetical protein